MSFLNFYQLLASPIKSPTPSDADHPEGLGLDSELEK